MVIVTYNSGRVLRTCLDALARQTRPADRVVIVDNHSPDTAYLDGLGEEPGIQLVRSAHNDGFCGGNNRGFLLARDCKYVLFLNPDAFATHRLLEDAVRWMELPQFAGVACLTGSLLEFDIVRQQPTGRIDSTGIFQTWFGKWYDRGQGAQWADPGAPAAPEQIPAVCGAFMFCRASALEQTLIRRDEVFDSRFFMYKEDIELSLRLRAAGWRLQYIAPLICYHGRGWQGRGKVSYRAKYLSARNELRVSRRNGLRGLPYSLLKFLYVVSLEKLVSRLRARRASGP